MGALKRTPLALLALLICISAASGAPGSTPAGATATAAAPADAARATNGTALPAARSNTTVAAAPVTDAKANSIPASGTAAANKTAGGALPAAAAPANATAAKAAPAAGVAKTNSSALATAAAANSSVATNATAAGAAAGAAAAKAPVLPSPAVGAGVNRAPPPLTGPPVLVSINPPTTAAAPPAPAPAPALAKAPGNGTKPKVLTIRLPAGTRPEGLARISDNELFVACLSGALLHVDLRTDTVTQVYDEPMYALSGAKWDEKQNALFVAATLSGKAFIYYLERAHRAPGGVGAVDDASADDYESEEDEEEGDGGKARARNRRGGGLDAMLERGAKRFATAPWQLKRRVAVQLARLPPWYINDVALSDEAVLFTDSVAGRLWAIPRFHAGKGAPPVAYYDLGAAFQTLPGQFKANGLAVLPPGAMKGPAAAAVAAAAAAAAAAAGNSSAAARGGAALAAAAAARRVSAKVGGGTGTPLLIANLHEGNLYRVVLPASKKKGKLAKGLLGGAGAADVTKVSLPAVAGRRLLLDGLIIADDHTVYAADNYHNRVVQLRLGVDAGSAAVTCVIEPEEYHVPTTLALTGSGSNAVLWGVNAHLDTCLPFVPCPRHGFELIGVRPAEFCDTV